MPQKDAAEIKDKIIRILRERGPSLPIQIANGVGLSMLFASAFLSELLSERKLKMTHMRVGSSPVYYLEGQEEGLEKYASYLKSKEKEAYEILKQHDFLIDSEQLPAIRVALRAIKDFAIPLQKQDGIWRYFLKKEEEYNLIEENSKEENLIIPPKEKIEEELVKDKPQEIEVQKEVIEKIEETIETKGNEDFTNKIKNRLLQSKIKLIEEIEIKKKEFIGVGRIETYLGEIEILIIGKDKKTITDKDLEKMFEQLEEQKKIVLFLSTGEITKKTKETYRTYKNIILFQKID
jgi:hypothetical protein